MPDAYPLGLLPQPAYLNLSAIHPSAGQLLRRTVGGVPLVSSVDGLINDELLTLPSPHNRDLIRGYSVNLLGDFQPNDLAWELNKAGARYQVLSTYWQPGNPILNPFEIVVPDEAARKSDEQWQYCWLLIESLHNQSAPTQTGPFRCEVRHRPTEANYWHYEIHFVDIASGADLAGSTYTDKEKKRLAERVRPWLRARMLTNPPESIPNAEQWPVAWYCPTC